MLDIQLFRDNPDLVKKALTKRHQETNSVDQVIHLDEKRRMLLQQVESLRAERNQTSKAIGKIKDPDERQEKIAATQGLGDQLAKLETELKELGTPYHTPQPYLHYLRLQLSFSQPLAMRWGGKLYIQVLRRSSGLLTF